MTARSFKSAAYAMQGTAGGFAPSSCSQIFVPTGAEDNSPWRAP